jgi:iron complex outermembrane receptor protein
MRLHNCALAVAVAAAFVAVPALAQTSSGQNSSASNTKTLQAIEVTGTRIKGSVLATSTPTLHISAQSIQKLGLTSIGEVLQQLPMAGASLNTHLDASGNFGANPDGSGVGAGAATLGLRNLNSKRTLVLVDGLRWVNGSSGSGVSASVDLNTIPMSAIQSIEILPNGASALYGSDAIAGVVNIVTKTYQPGGKFHAYYGNSSLSGGAVSKGSLSFGGQTHGFRYFMSIDQTIQQPISSATWQGSSGCIPSTGLLDCSAFTPLGQFVFTAPGGNTYGGLCPGGVCNITPDKALGPGESTKFPSGFGKFTNADRYVYGPTELLQLAVRTRGFYGSMEYNFTPNIQGYVRVTESKRRSENQDAPTQMGFSSTCAPGAPCISQIAADNPYNPFGFALTPSDPNFLAQVRFTGFGPRKFTQNVHTHYFSTGLNGAFMLGSRSYNWDVNFADANNDATSFGQNITNSLAVRLALGPLADCTAIPSCVPLNIFGGPSGITPAMKNFITTTSLSKSHQALELWTADLSGDIVKLPAGEMQFAAGYEHRSVSGYFHPNPFSVTGITGLPTLPTHGGFNVDAGYLELNIPVLKGLPGIQSFSADFASRIANYSTFGETADSRAALRWQPITDLTFRGTWGQGFRAPSIGELFGADQFLNELVIDPCNHDSPVMSPQVAANCKLQGVPNPATF